MSLAKDIRKMGFRRWHERTLLISHAWLLLTLVAGVIGFGAMESILQGHGLPTQLMNGLVALGAAVVVLLSLQRFLAGLVRAQQASSQATCPHCETFGWLAVVAEGREENWLRVRCRECDHEWVIEEG